jgi:uncharacterized RDD family membrane protein YckC
LNSQAGVGDNAARDIEAAEEVEVEAEPAYYTNISTAHTVTPRYIAAGIDNVFTMVIAIFAAKVLAEGRPVVQGVLLAVVYLAYFFVFEGLLARTPGKFLTGLVVVGIEGDRCTWKQATIRTLFRLLEVNPALLGAIPAALSVVFSPYHQRFGDKAAETLVVETRVLRRGQ